MSKLFFLALQAIPLLCKPDESNYGALLKFPYEPSTSQLSGISWDVAPSQFGFHKYGGSIEAYLVLPANGTYHLECTKEKSTNPYIHFLQDHQPNDDFVLIIDRGDCYFIDKVAHAQSLGAIGAIVIDKREESPFTMWMPHDWKDNITIPSVLLQKSKGELLMKHLGVIYQNTTDNNDKDHSKIPRYPGVYDLRWTKVLIEWGLPHDDDRVEWELWTSSNDLKAVQFKQQFMNVSIALDAANDTVFTPWMYILNGSHWGCDDTRLRCGNQCSNSGRYCAVDPELDTSMGLSGIDVIKENLRSICVWKYAKEKTKVNKGSAIWWRYSVAWDANCGSKVVSGVRVLNSAKFNEECSYAQMDAIVEKKGLSNYVKSCVQNSGGYGKSDGLNTILDEHVKERRTQSVYAMPMVRVNEFLVHGKIDCTRSTVEECQVLAAICAGYLVGTEPHICDRTPRPTMMPTSYRCEDSSKDCRGVCYKEFPLYVLDACGRCLRVDDYEEIDKCGCSGKVDGSKINECGICYTMENVTKWKSYGKDCRGECQGFHEVDECGKCLLPRDKEWNSCVEIGKAEVVDDGKESKGSKALIAIGVVIVVALVVVGITGLCYLKRKQESVEERLKNIASTYKMMDEFEPKSKNVNKKGVAVPDDEDML